MSGLLRVCVGGNMLIRKLVSLNCTEVIIVIMYII